MAAVPRHELTSGMAARQQLAVDPQRPVGCEPGRVDDRVVTREEFGSVDIGTQFDATEEAHVRMLENLAQSPGDRLDPGMIWCDPMADEPERSAEPVEQIDLHRHHVLPHEFVGRVQTGRPGPDDRDARELPDHLRHHLTGRTDIPAVRYSVAYSGSPASCTVGNLVNSEANATCSSIRASGAPRQWCTPWLSVRCRLGVRVTSNAPEFSNSRGS